VNLRCLQFLDDFVELCSIARAKNVKLLPVLWDFHALEKAVMPGDPSYNQSTPSMKGHVGLFTVKACVNDYVNNALSKLLQRYV
jgi:hypothetical protein